MCTLLLLMITAVLFIMVKLSFELFKQNHISLISATIHSLCSSSMKLLSKSVCSLDVFSYIFISSAIEVMVFVARRDGPCPDLLHGFGFIREFIPVASTETFWRYMLSNRAEVHTSCVVHLGETVSHGGNLSPLWNNGTAYIAMHTRSRACFYCHAV